MKADFSTHRPLVMGTRWMIVAGHPLAAQAGSSILEQGGSAVDAAIAANAVLTVVRPHMCGPGGDLFALIYDKKRDELKAVNASGRSPFDADLDSFLMRGMRKMPEKGLFATTVPGVIDGWSEMHEKYGRLPFGRLFERAIELAAEGFPMYGEMSAAFIEHAGLLKKSPAAMKVFFPEGREPKPGERLIQKDLANSLQKIAEEGRDVFYRGELGQAFLQTCQQHKTFFSMQDLEKHTTTWCEPIQTDYRGFTLTTTPPNTQGLAWLMTANMLENFDLAAMEHNSADYAHLFIEAKKMAFADRDRYVCDPECHHIPVRELLSKDYARKKIEKIQMDRAATDICSAEFNSCGEDTVYLMAVDQEGNAVSLIQSLYEPFGSGVMVDGTGILVHNRGRDFRMESRHFNCIGPHKRPYHTLVPGMILRNGKPFILLGSPGADGQTQTLMQLTANLLDFNADPQGSVEAPRWRSNPDYSLQIENRFSVATLAELEAKGHHLDILPGFDKVCGGAQVIQIDKRNGILAAGADPRRQAYAIGC